MFGIWRYHAVFTDSPFELVSVAYPKGTRFAPGGAIEPADVYEGKALLTIASGVRAAAFAAAVAPSGRPWRGR